MANAGLAHQVTLHTIRMVLTCAAVGREWAGLKTTTFTLSQVSKFVALLISQWKLIKVVLVTGSRIIRA